MTDLFNECLSDLDPKDKNPQAFKETFCSRCRNAECVHARRATDTFIRRVQTQEDRFFNPHVLTPTENPKYAMLSDLPSISEKVSSKIRSSWGPPGAPMPKDDEEENEKKPVFPTIEEPEVRGEGNTEEEFLEPEENLVSEQELGPRQHAPSLLIKPGNTSVPAGGIILPGVSKTPPKSRPVDPWAPPPPKPKLVEPGATIKMGVLDNDPPK
ncbi:MAG: hypothetical protein WC824_13625 [Bacteroidota bacterium]|jgi:hypothetical protein